MSITNISLHGSVLRADDGFRNRDAILVIYIRNEPDELIHIIEHIRRHGLAHDVNIDPGAMGFFTHHNVDVYNL
jgi:hypothetical protein